MKSSVFGGTSLYSLLVLTVLSRAALATPVAKAELVNLDKRACIYPLGGLQKPYSLIANTAISNAGSPLSITGNIGVCPAGSITGITPAEVTGTIESNTPAACSAQSAAQSACNCAAAFMPVTLEPYSDITGKIFTPGAYSFSGGVTLHGTVTFSGTGQFYMHIDSFTTSGSPKFVLSNGATACNIFWIFRISCVLGSSVIVGNICSTNSCSFGAGVDVTGMVYGGGGSISLSGGTFRKCG